MVILLTLIHIIVCLFLVIVVLLQSGKAADLAGAFGGMGSQTAFGPRGAATVLSKATTAAAALFMVTSLTLAIIASRGAGSTGGSTVLERTQAPKPATKSGQPPAPQGAQPVPLQPAPNQPVPASVSVGEGPARPGQPSMTLTDPATGASKTVPIKITPAEQQQQKPAEQAPAKK
jgi:preprotein translocase subunit SecG